MILDINAKIAMELILQQNLPHQQKAIDAVCATLDGVSISSPAQFYENPQINLADSKLAENLRQLQSSIPAEYRNKSVDISCLNLDIKMETGTGKTYVYTKTIYELHKRYGFNKFIIAVPSLAIKAGTAQFIRDDYSKRHFYDGCGYRAEIELGVLDAPKNKKKGRNFFPHVVSDFVKGSCQNTRKIYVLLVNMQLITSNQKRDGRDTGLLWRDDYDDCSAAGFYQPFNALCATKPILIIDEPHRFSRNQQAFQTIMTKIKPQAVIRYGATFPDISTGKGKNKVNAKKDYQYLLYDLNACESFNQGLIKGVAKEHFEPSSKQNEKVKILSISGKESVTFQYKKLKENPRTFTLKKDDSLAIISDAFEGITIKGIASKSVEFSNGVEKYSGEEMDVDVYMSSYQEQMIKLALEHHFKTEKENFDRKFKIKTLALFFIDDISSYRPNSEGKKTYLRLAFDKQLEECIKETINSLNEQETEYKAYLEASLADLSKCQAGYFSQDNSDSDENIAEEVDVILNGKKELLSFKNPDGSYNTRRFLFSKWTLKEGWDNPNVFTIAKLRSSGSENSKLQEVGRGLRLPVDENGNRISNEVFQLNYIVDFTEADFAQKLVDQINEEIPQTTIITEEHLETVAQKLGKTANDLFDELYQKHYIDRKNNIQIDTRDLFFEEYPLFATGLSAGKVRDLNKGKPKPIKIRKALYSEIRELWEHINQRYLLFYESKLNADMEAVVVSLFEKRNVFTDFVMSSSREIVQYDGSQMKVVIGAGVQYSIYNPIPYGAFLSRIAQSTNIPIATLHSAMIKFSQKHGKVESKYFNENSASAFCVEFQNWKTTELQGRFHYAKSKSSCGATALTYANGTPKDEITQGLIGTKIIENFESEKYLYAPCTYDSPLEKDNITTDIEEVVVYAKIPRKSIAIPTITGGTYSPDFMYVVRKKSGEKELNVIVETKDVGKDALRKNEEAKINCAKVFFDHLSSEGYKVHFMPQIKNQKMRQIINDVMNKT